MTRPSKKTINYTGFTGPIALLIAGLAIATGPVWLWAFVALIAASIAYFYADDVRTARQTCAS
jgi:hypothetical protein